MASFKKAEIKVDNKGNKHEWQKKDSDGNVTHVTVDLKVTLDDGTSDVRRLNDIELEGSTKTEKVANLLDHLEKRAKAIAKSMGASEPVKEQGDWSRVYKFSSLT